MEGDKTPEVGEDSSTFPMLKLEDMMAWSKEVSIG
jgi:hypothetical protein